jgi:DNA polymerase-4/protein ImuB
MRRRLGLLGLETMGDIALLPLGAFQQQFGPEGKRCWELANGIDDEPLAPRVREETIVRRLEMPAPSVSLDAILAGVERLVYAAYGDPGRKGRWACLSGRQVRKAVVRAALDGPDGQAGGTWELAVPFREALADPRDAWFAVKSAVERHPPQRPVEELEVELVGLSAESGKQATMFDGKAKLNDQITETVRQLQAQHGQVALGKVVEVEPWSRIPERRAAMLEFGP